MVDGPSMSTWTRAPLEEARCRDPGSWTTTSNRPAFLTGAVASSDFHRRDESLVHTVLRIPAGSPSNSALHTPHTFYLNIFIS